MNHQLAITLSDMKPGEQGRVLSFQAGFGVYRGNLLAMGFTPGVEFTIIHVAPLGDPLLVKIRGSSLSLRKKEAMALFVERVES